MLALPKKNFARIAAIAQKADGRAILRATELLAKAETDLRFVSSPRICLETALMKIAVPAADDSIDALLVRINTLEKRLQEGNIQAAPMIKQQPAPKPLENNYEFPMEEPVFEEAYFSDEPIAPKRETKPESAAPVKKAPEPMHVTPQPVNVAPAAQTAPAEGMTAQLAFGKFLRLLRKANKGVLYTMCADLDASFEGARLVLFTESGTVHRALSREDNRKVMSETFAELGISEFEVRLRGAEPTDEKSAVEQLKRDFKDYPIEIK